MGHSIDTIDCRSIEDFDKYIFFDFPNRAKQLINQLAKRKKEMFLVALESPLANSGNYECENHKYFKKIFTWNDELVDNVKYIKLNLANKIQNDLKLSHKDRKLCVLIASNRSSQHSQELYSERSRAIEWFQTNAPADFDLFGYGWNKYIPRNDNLAKKIQRVAFREAAGRLAKEKYTSYRGTVKGKLEILSQYKYSICYENAKGYYGYISEKIFDSLMAEYVPIYLGSENIDKYIPRNCFIDKRNYSGYFELYKDISTEKSEILAERVENIREYLGSSFAFDFSAERFSEIIIREIFGSL